MPRPLNSIGGIFMATTEWRGDTCKITVSCGYDINKKQIRKHMTWEPEPGMTEKQIEKELNRQTVLFEEKCKTGQVLDGSIKFFDFAEKWFKEHAEKQLKAKTLNRYRALMKRITPAIGHLQLNCIQPHHLSAFYDNLAEAGVRGDIKYRCTVDFMALLRRNRFTKGQFAETAGVCIAVLNSVTQGKNISEKSAGLISKALSCKVKDIFEPVNAQEILSAKTILHYHRLISSILQMAVFWEVIFANPCQRVKPPKPEDPEPRYLDEEQAARLLELLEQENMQRKTIIKLLMYTGLRRGELCGLEWKDIKWSKQLMTVCRSSLYLPEKGIFTDTPKNKNSIRTIKVSPSVITMLQDYRKWQIECRLSLGDRWEDTDRLFTKWNGKPINPDSITDWFHGFLADKDLPPISIHSLRHTNATLQIAAGVPLPTIAKRLGHANTVTTTKIYAHAIKSADEAAAEIIEDILNPAQKRGVQ